MISTKNIHVKRPGGIQVASLFSGRTSSSIRYPGGAHGYDRFFTRCAKKIFEEVTPSASGAVSRSHSFISVFIRLKKAPPAIPSAWFLICIWGKLWLVQSFIWLLKLWEVLVSGLRRNDPIWSCPNPLHPLKPPFRQGRMKGKQGGLYLMRIEIHLRIYNRACQLLITICRATPR